MGVRGIHEGTKAGGSLRLPQNPGSVEVRRQAAALREDVTLSSINTNAEVKAKVKNTESANLKIGELFGRAAVMNDRT